MNDKISNLRIYLNEYIPVENWHIETFLVILVVLFALKLDIRNKIGH